MSFLKLSSMLEVEAAIWSAPTLVVMTNIALGQSIVFPLPSVNLPSSNSCGLETLKIIDLSLQEMIVYFNMHHTLNEITTIFSRGQKRARVVI